MTARCGPDRDGTWPFVTVVMPVRDAARAVETTLGALLCGDYPPASLEVLVIDGRSTDGTRERVRRVAETDGRVRLLDNPRRTTPAGLNVGLAAARGDVIVRLDGHARPAPDYVRACVEALDATGAWAVGGPMVGRGETAFGRAVAVAASTPLGAGDARFRLGGAGPTDTVYLGAWRRDVFDRIGRFDEGLPRNQDYELSVRIRQAGGEVWLTPTIRSTTVTRATPKALARQYFDYGTGRAGTWVRHPGSLRARQVVPAGFVATVGAGVVLGTRFRALRLSVAALLGTYAGVLFLASGHAAVGPRRVPPPVALRLPLAYAVMHGAWGTGFWVGLWRAWRERRSG